MGFKHLPLLLLLFAFTLPMFAQEPDLTPWTSRPYGNEWIDYTKKYVRVGVEKDGFYTIPLTALSGQISGLTTANVQCWFRGQQIPLQIEGNNIIFYGRRNDGASDGLMFRDANNQLSPQSRLNTYDSFFSEQGAHFFTKANDSETALRINSVAASPGVGATAETHHIEKLIYSSGQTYQPNGRRENMTIAFRSSDYKIKNPPNHSYFTSVDAFIELEPTERNYTELIPRQITLRNRVTDTSEPITLDFSVHGDDNGSRTLFVKVAPDDASLNEKVIFSGVYSGLIGAKEQVQIPAGNLNASHSAEIRFDFIGARAGVSFCTISFPQSIDMNGANSKKFYFKGGTTGKSRVAIESVPANSQVFDITNPSAPRRLTGAYENQKLIVEVDRVSGQALILQVVAPAGFVSIAQNSPFISDVKFDLLYSWKPLGADVVKPDPADYDYLIITSSHAAGNAAAAIEYAQYRHSPDGGGHRALVISTRSIYDQFNYGEPSPVAISRFVNYMISEGVRSNHYVLLASYGVGRPTNIEKELPNDIPTYGNPGSDALLVSGLSNAPGSHKDIPAVPIGRITAFNNTHLRNYLNKVKEYEAQTKSGVDLAWRRNVINLLGIKENREINSFNKAIDDASVHINNTWNVTEISNESRVPPSGEAGRFLAPISSHINNGTGMIGYYGHGNQSGTLYNIGLPSNYPEQPKKYPFIYITGCGVGDVFDSHNAAPSTALPVNEWIHNENKGAIAILANTYLAYVTQAAFYMEKLYQRIFIPNDANRRPIGVIQMELARDIIGGGSGARVQEVEEYLRAHVHQTALFGDPAIRLLMTTDAALPVTYAHFTGRTTENNSVVLNWETATEKDNDKFIIERSFDGKSFHEIGNVKAKTTLGEIVGASYDFIDQSPKAGINYYRLKQFDLASSESGNNQFSYSNIISVEVQNDGRLDPVIVYPVPTRDRITITLNKAYLLKWRLIDNMGRVIRSGTQQSVSLTDLVPGSFILEITDSENAVFRKQVIKY